MRVRTELPQLWADIDSFFEAQAGAYCVRISTLSPKDACLPLMYNNDDQCDAPVEERVGILRVTDVGRCIEVLCHSQRVFIDLEYEISPEHIVLLPWLETLEHQTETRCFVRNGKVEKLSQYYTDDFVDYDINPQAFMEEVVRFVENLPSVQRMVNVVADVGRVDHQLMLVELNTFDEMIDTCLFEDAEIVLSYTGPVEGRYKCKDKVCKVFINSSH